MKVVVGMSGGVDSSVAAILLKEQGYEVIGITFAFTEDFDPTDAIKISKKLNIEHHIIDYKELFKNKVINRFINDYKSGITPNPCILCNREVKFNFLYQQMLEFNCDYIATGHYAKIIDGSLFKSRDLKKDQTYFLAQLTKEQLSRLILPLEGITKDEVREIARKYDLELADKKDSTDVCFITTNFKEYINNQLKNINGDVIDVKTGKKIGEHAGLTQYTIGQRKGLNLGGNAERIYVVGKNLNENVLYVASGDDNEYLISTSAIIEKVNWPSDKKPIKCAAKFRYHQPDNEVELEYLEDGNILVKYSQGVKAVTPGQACVFYLGEECLGGGIIKEVQKDNKKLWYL